MTTDAASGPGSLADAFEQASMAGDVARIVVDPSLRGSVIRIDDSLELTGTHRRLMIDGNSVTVDAQFADSALVLRAAGNITISSVDVVGATGASIDIDVVSSAGAFARSSFSLIDIDVRGGTEGVVVDGDAGARSVSVMLRNSTIEAADTGVQLGVQSGVAHLAATRSSIEADGVAVGVIDRGAGSVNVRLVASELGSDSGTGLVIGENDRGDLRLMLSRTSIEAPEAARIGEAGIGRAVVRLSGASTRSFHSGFTVTEADDGDVSMQVRGADIVAALAPFDEVSGILVSESGRGNLRANVTRVTVAGFDTGLTVAQSDVGLGTVRVTQSDFSGVSEAFVLSTPIDRFIERRNVLPA